MECGCNIWRIIGTQDRMCDTPHAPAPGLLDNHLITSSSCPRKGPHLPLRTGRGMCSILHYGVCVSVQITEHGLQKHGCWCELWCRLSAESLGALLCFDVRRLRATACWNWPEACPQRSATPYTHSLHTLHHTSLIRWRQPVDSLPFECQFLGHPET